MPIRTNVRVLLGYVLIILFPFFIVLNFLSDAISDRNTEQRSSILDVSAESYGNLIDQHLAQVSYVANFLRGNTALMDLLSGNLYTVSDEIYTYNRYILPMFNHFLLTNASIRSIKIYRRHPSFIDYKRYIMPYENLPLTEEESADVLDKSEKWIRSEGDERSLSYTYYCVFTYNDYLTNLGILEISVDLSELLESIERNASPALIWRDLASGETIMPAGWTEPLSRESALNKVVDVPELSAQMLFVDTDAPSSDALAPVFVVAFAALTLLSVLYYLLLGGYLSRLTLLARHIQSDTTARSLTIYSPPDKKRDEVGTLVTAYNALVDQVNDLIDGQYVSEINRRKAENYAMRMQINPHFLYNALESVRMLAYAHGDEQVSEIIYTLSRFMRYNLSDDAKAVTLAKEIQHISDYLAIMKLHMEDRLKWTIEVDAALPDIACPFFILQPIVENSFKHGFRNKLDTAVIGVRIERADHGARVVISDNGRGLSAGEVAEVNLRLAGRVSIYDSHIGLNNVSERMRAFCGGLFEMRIDGTPGQGARTIMLIKGREGEGHEDIACG